MRVLVIGQGGRESAIVRALNFSTSVSEIHVIRGNPGIKKSAICHDIAFEKHEEVLKLVKKIGIDLVVIGPETPVAEGLSDFLRENNLAVFGPSKKGAQLEASKLFCKEFLEKAKIPTARYCKVSSVEDVLKNCEKFQAPWVLKADGLAAGKGVFILKTKNELVLAAQLLFGEKKLGVAGSVALLEENLKGWELSYMIVTNGKEYQPLPLSQDHKRLLDNDEGPNTGGMGAVAPIPLEAPLEFKIKNEIVDPFLEELSRQNILYRGVVYFGIMMTAEGPKVLEINVRFGDPEAQVLLPLLNGDWGMTFKSIAEGTVPSLKWKPLSAACVVMAASGYPDKPALGDVLEGNIFDETVSSYFVHAGIDLNLNRDYVTSGGRVLGAVGLGTTLPEALKAAFLQTKKVSWPGVYFRKDIGKKIL